MSAFFELGRPAMVSALLLFCRVAPALRFMPFFGGAPMPRIAWLSLSAALTLVLMPLAGISQVTSAPLALLTAKELFVGTVIGILIRLAFSVLESTGALTLRAAFPNRASPGESNLSRLYTVTGIGALLAVDGHHAVVRGFAATLACAPLHRLPEFGPEIGSAQAVAVFSAATGAAVTIAVPLFGAALLAELLPAIAARFIPDGITATREALRSVSVLLVATVTFGFAVRISLTLLTDALDRLARCSTW